ncbi:MAG TPA: hypothetical protein DCE44_23280, partial [Verrucomicrobiales bacterium]|nr:hypothetical protein [Verrucomicrobiales bacterium]
MARTNTGLERSNGSPVSHADPLESFKTYKDSTFVMMREAARRGWRLAACEPAQLSWRSGAL